MASSPYFINNFTHIWDQFLFRQYETWVTVGSYFHFFKIFVAIRKHLLDLAMVGIPNNGWDTAAIILFLNNIFIPFFDAIEYLMDLAPIDDSGSALNGLAPFLEITDGQPHIMYFLSNQWNLIAAQWMVDGDRSQTRVRKLSCLFFWFLLISLTCHQKKLTKRKQK